MPTTTQTTPAISVNAAIAFSLTLVETTIAGVKVQRKREKAANTGGLSLLGLQLEARWRERPGYFFFFAGAAFLAAFLTAFFVAFIIE